MKAIALIFLTIFMAKGCSQESKNDMANAVLQYSANKRGFYERITIQERKIYISHDRNSADRGLSKEISEKDWKELVGYFQTIKLDSLGTFKDPTQKRYYDGAAIANLKVTYKEKDYQTTEFDHGYPPVEIEKFVNKIVSLEKEE